MKKIKKNITILALSLLCSSCLELQPLSSLGDEYVWTSSSNFELFANQFYAWDRGFSTMVGSTHYADVTGDLIAVYSTSNEYSQGVHTVPNTDSQYGTQYKRIYYCNLLLKNAAEYGDQSSISTPMGTAYYYRALAHFELVRMYGDAIILTEPIDMDSEKLSASQDNRDDVIDLVISDLQMAIELLPESTSVPVYLTKYKALAKLAHIALFEGTWQKFHNHCSGGAEDEWGNFSYTSFGSYELTDQIDNTERSTQYLTLAKEAAKEVMESGVYELFRNETLGDESYRCMFFLDDAAQCNVAGVSASQNPEYILVDYHKDGDSMTSVTHTVLNNAWVATRKMADMYLCSDGVPIDKSNLFQSSRESYTTEFLNRDPRMEQSLLVRSQQYWSNNASCCRIYWDDRDYDYIQTKNNCEYTGYWNRKWGAERRVDSGYESMDFPIMRYAEVLLIYAEACYELDNYISNEDLNISINLLRDRVSMPYLTIELANNYELSMREEIRRERTVELFTEGFRTDDLRRWAMGSTEMPGDLMGVHKTGTIYESVWPTTSSSTTDSNGDIVFRTGRQWVDSKHYLYPLPIDEMELNPSLRQTAGW